MSKNSQSRPSNRGLIRPDKVLRINEGCFTLVRVNRYIMTHITKVFMKIIRHSRFTEPYYVFLLIHYSFPFVLCIKLLLPVCEICLSIILICSSFCVLPLNTLFLCLLRSRVLHPVCHSRCRFLIYNHYSKSSQTRHYIKQTQE